MMTTADDLREALRSRAAGAPDADVVFRRIEAELAVGRPPVRRRRMLLLGALAGAAALAVAVPPIVLNREDPIAPADESAADTPPWVQPTVSDNHGSFMGGSGMSSASATVTPPGRPVVVASWTGGSDFMLTFMRTESERPHAEVNDFGVELTKAEPAYTEFGLGETREQVTGECLGQEATVQKYVFPRHPDLRELELILRMPGGPWAKVVSSDPASTPDDVLAVCNGLTTNPIEVPQAFDPHVLPDGFSVLIANKFELTLAPPATPGSDDQRHPRLTFRLRSDIDLSTVAGTTLTVGGNPAVLTPMAKTQSMYVLLPTQQVLEITTDFALELTTEDFVWIGET